MIFSHASSPSSSGNKAGRSFTSFFRSAGESDWMACCQNWTVTMRGRKSFKTLTRAMVCRNGLMKLRRSIKPARHILLRFTTQILTARNEIHGHSPVLETLSPASGRNTAGRAANLPEVFGKPGPSGFAIGETAFGSSRLVSPGHQELPRCGTSTSRRGLDLGLDRRPRQL